MNQLTFITANLIISTIGLVVSYLLFWGQTIPSISSKILSGLVLSLVITALGNLLPLTSIYVEFPELYRIHAFAPLCIGPFTYLYIKYVLRQHFRFLKKDLWVFLPMVLYLLNRLPFYFLSHEEKLDFVIKTLKYNHAYILEPDGWLPTGWIAIFRVSILLFFLTWSLLILLQWRKKILHGKDIIKRNIHIYRFLWALLLFLIIGSCIVFGYTITQVKAGISEGQSSILAGELTIIAILIEILLISFYLLTQPKILYGMIGWIQVDKPVRFLKEHTELEELENDQFISVYRGKRILDSINQHFNKKHPFTKIGYTITDLSKEINIPSYLISPVINQEFGKNFSEYINDARINHLTYLKENDPQFDNYTIEHIGQAIGFGSRTSFITNVKNRTGLLPKEYLASL